MSNVAELLIPSIRWDPERGYDPERETIARALDLGVGGFILFGGPEGEVRALTKELRTRSKVPLLIGADLERGAAQQFPGTIELPPLAAIASLSDTNVVARAAKLTARESRTIGVNWNYAPVCDLDILPDNPTVGTRALGSDPQKVGVLASAWIEACQHEGVLACAKHFPGHGRTGSRRRAEPPTVDAPRSVLFETDFVPFRSAISSRVASIMTAHVIYPALDASRSPASISTQILRYLLREKLGFDGLIVTGALAMMAELRSETEAEAAVRALDAGCDLLLRPSDPERVMRVLEIAVRDGPLDEDRIHQSRRRRLKWAQWAAPPTDYRRVTGSDVAWAAQLAERVVQVVRGEPARPRSPAEIVVIDDDAGSTHPAPARSAFTDALRAGQLAVSEVDAPTVASHGALLIALFGEGRADVERPSYSERTRTAVTDACVAARSAGRDSVVVQFGHPRLADQVGVANHIVCAWSGERLMQEAAARWLLARAER